MSSASLGFNNLSPSSVFCKVVLFNETASPNFIWFNPVAALTSRRAMLRLNRGGVLRLSLLAMHLICISSSRTSRLSSVVGQAGVYSLRYVLGKRHYRRRSSTRCTELLWPSSEGWPANCGPYKSLHKSIDFRRRSSRREQAFQVLSEVQTGNPPDQAKGAELSGEFHPKPTAMKPPAPPLSDPFRTTEIPKQQPTERNQ